MERGGVNEFDVNVSHADLGLGHRLERNQTQCCTGKADGL